MNGEILTNTPSPQAKSPRLSVAVRLPYVTPTLKHFGSVSKLTMGKTGSIADNMNRSKMAMSDRRLKEDIVRVGDHPLGFGIYLFSYKAAYQETCGAGRHLGVMADEVEPILPKAVSVGTDGFKVVDYSLLIPGRNRASH